MDIQKHKSTLYVFMLVANIALGTFYVGYMIGVFNPTQASIEIIDNFGDQKAFYNGLVTALMPVGAVIGCFLGGLLAGKIGRRKVFILADLIGIIGSAIMTLKGDVPLLLGRTITGVAVGINSAIIPLFINEISPKKISGLMGAMTQGSMNVGILVSFLLGLNIAKSSVIRADPDAQYWWRVMFGFPIILPFLRSFFLLTIFKFETPSFLISTGQDEEAKKVLDKIYFQEHSGEVYDELKSKITACKDVSYSELCGRKYRGRLGMGILLSLIQQFSGVNAVLFYSNKIFKGDGDPDAIDPFDEEMADVFTILIGVILIFSAWLSGKFIDKFGRKSILLLGELLCILTLSLLTIFGFLDMTNPSKYIILLFMFSFGISLGPIVWLYLPEFLPEKGVSIAALANWVGCGIIGFCFPMVTNALQIQGAFAIFLGCCIFAFFYMAIFVKETKGKTREEIDAMFSGVEEETLEEDDGKKSLISATTGNSTIP